MVSKVRVTTEQRARGPTKATLRIEIWLAGLRFPVMALVWLVW